MGKNSPALLTEEDSKDIDFGKILNDSLNVFFKDALRITLKNPSHR